MIRFVCIFVLIAGSWVGCATNPESRNTATAPELHLFLLAGQSNMAGRGLVTSDRLEPIPGVMALQQDGSWGDAIDPLHWDKRIAGVSVARSFARAYMRENPGVTVGFIPAACGGSPLEAWVDGYYYLPTKSYPLEDALARTRGVLWRGELKAVLWHQGESDSRPERALKYEDRLTVLIDRFRTEFGDPDLPFLVGQLGKFDGSEWSDSRKQVDQIQRRIAASDKRVGFVSSEGLDSKEDRVHFDADALDAFGARYAAELELITVTGD